jgi:hypothetical protein
MNSLERLARRVLRLEHDLKRATTTPQLAHSSVEDGALRWNRRGQQTIVIGTQPDGTNAPVVVSGPTPPMLAGCTAEEIVGALLVGWDGTWDSGLVAPLDFSRAEIHVSAAGPDFVPDLVGSESTTLRGTIGSVRGGKYAVGGLEYADHWVKVVARTLAGKWGEPTPAIGPVRPQKTDTIDIADEAVKRAQIANEAIDGSKLAAGAVDSTKIADFSVLVTKFASTRHMLY